MNLMMMKKKKKIMLIPYPAQGHVTPMLKLASVLSNLGFKPVIITPEFIHTRISSQINPTDHGILSLSINPHGGLDTAEEKDFFAIEMAMEKYMPLYLEKIILNMDDEDDGDGIACLVVDLLSSWAVDVASRCGVPVAGFWPAMQSTYRLIAAIPDLIRRGVISEHGSPEDENAAIIFSPNDPPLSPNDLPWLIGSPSSRNSRFKFWTRTLERSKTLPWILTNSFPDESQSNTHQSSTNQRIFEIGPLIMQSASISNPSFWEEDLSCLKWLDNQKIGSVVYISFGSWVSPIGEEKVRNLALALESAQRPFLWVLAPAWRRGLPDGYADGMGKVVSWAPQMEVLRHPGVGCYLSHCGWNSTVEGIQCKKPFLCYPIAGDQFLNRDYIVNVWKIGVKVEDGFGEVEKGIRNVLDDEEMGFRIERLNDKVFGKEGTSTAMSSLCQFIQHI
ncbi:hypothetical protein RD792_006910 [Penstemon davidsonii]|uniref:Glycosyltransferase n=1 Tax=Penstemon davidsonii TaxID=160366 RepID=A0ABR0D6A4_9LAMI|nr:hypothetical protein RD792_006910 [Penstemon davidsonii]